MTSIVNERALSDFLDSADLGEARRVQAALEAMAASVRLKVVELENQDPVIGFTPKPVQSVGCVYERVCTCHKERRYPAPKKLPDAYEFENHRHGPNCSLLKIPDIAEKPEIWKLSVTAEHHASYSRARCSECGMVWTVFENRSKIEANA
jgi:hypothetical protein